MKTGLFSKTILPLIAVFLLFPVFAMINHREIAVPPPKNNISPEAGEGIAVMELFTSQGCSSCPPADALLAEYAKAGNPHIIPLSFHVDYWNRLGWTDPFSSNQFSERQQWYSGHLPGGTVYTPQLVVNGNTETVGNNRKMVSNLVEKALKTTTAENIAVDNIMIENKHLHFHYAVSGNRPTEILNIALVEKAATTKVLAGENKGVAITNLNIVRSFKTTGLVSENNETIPVPAGFEKGAYALVLYTQNQKSLFISAAVIKQI